MTNLRFLSAFLSCSTLVSCILASSANLQRRDGFIPSGPKFVVYSASAVDEGVLPPLHEIQGFNVLNLAFLQCDGPYGQAKRWADLPIDQRQQLKAQYNAAGVSLVVAAFGANDLPTTNGLDPTTIAGTMAQFVLDNNLDGVDVDYEELELMRSQAGVGETWVSTFTQALRARLPQGQFIISHAPVAPWFEPYLCPGGCYLTVHQNVGDLIDWYNIQFYNQSPDPGYENCDTLLYNAGGSSVFEILGHGVDQSKIVIGKPASTQDMTNGGYMDPAALSTCVAQAVGQGWNAGVMTYQFPHADTAWLSAVKGSSFNQ
ncbi:chitinase [Dichomitus squalens]|uniref:Chitinase n=1 Tax=Dichomitus squalens TaxID=114155 RepID=A0A4Q9MXG9_9APHY|nr:chitinase [Dichomitus squalens]